MRSIWAGEMRMTPHNGTIIKVSKDGSAANGGDLDWANAGSYVPEFSKAMVDLKKGAITETPVKTQYGYHVIEAISPVRPAKKTPLAEVKIDSAANIVVSGVAPVRISQ